ncbi:MAG TPA: hypothetical protein VFN02_13925 [Ktedonobacteraceae bacterium]|nr:hypothetical protein [Ktedonobacteraceae bacterium]
MYYRVAIQEDTPPSWRWKSSVLSSLNSLFQWFRLFRALPDHLRIFSSSSREGLAEQFEQESKGLASHSVTAAQFLRERLIRLPMVQGTSEQEGETSQEMVSLAVTSQERVNKRSGGGSTLESRGMSALERRREELESGSGGDQDLPYRFSLPISLPQVLAWITLREKVQQGELHP